MRSFSFSLALSIDTNSSGTSSALIADWTGAGDAASKAMWKNPE